MSQRWWEFTPEQAERLREIQSGHSLAACPFVEAVKAGSGRAGAYRRSPKWRRVPTWTAPEPVSGEIEDAR